MMLMALIGLLIIALTFIGSKVMYYYSKPVIIKKLESDKEYFESQAIYLAQRIYNMENDCEYCELCLEKNKLILSYQDEIRKLKRRFETHD